MMVYDIVGGLVIVGLITVGLIKTIEFVSKRREEKTNAGTIEGQDRGDERGWQ